MKGLEEDAVRKEEEIANLHAEVARLTAQNAEQIKSADKKRRSVSRTSASDSDVKAELKKLKKKLAVEDALAPARASPAILRSAAENREDSPLQYDPNPRFRVFRASPAPSEAGSSPEQSHPARVRPSVGVVRKSEAKRNSSIPPTYTAYGNKSPYGGLA